jgi:hypothetical protein
MWNSTILNLVGITAGAVQAFGADRLKWGSDPYRTGHIDLREGFRVGEVQQQIRTRSGFVT